MPAAHILVNENRPAIPRSIALSRNLSRNLNRRMAGPAVRRMMAPAHRIGGEVRA